MILLLSLYSVNALIISEVEANPDGKDSKNEWIELFSSIEIDGEYIIKNNDEDELKMNFNFVGYHIYGFSTQWLDNFDEKIYLYDSKNNLIDSTNIFDDGEDSENTWQRCDDTWIFEKQTKEVKNCEEVIEEEEEIIKEDIKEEDYKRENEGEDEEEKTERIVETVPLDAGQDRVSGTEEIIEEVIDEDVLTGSVIKLDSKDIKSNVNKKGVNKNNFATIGLGFIALLLFILLVSQRYKRTKKNEFRGN
jgi:hypothetical protein